MLGANTMKGVRLPFLPLFLISPAIIFFSSFFLLPFVQAIGLAFTTRTGELTLNNFSEMYGQIYFRSALANTLLLTAVVIPTQLLIALIISLSVNTRLFGSTKFLYICAIPIAISEITAGIIWLSIFTERGYLNTILYGLKLIERPIIFLSYEHPEHLLTAVSMAEVWRATAIVMLILVAGLQMINQDYLDAAEIFGASRLQKLKYVILPLLKPSIQTALIVRTVLAFQVFATVLVLTGRMVPVLAGEAYLAQVWMRNPHLASAYGLIMMAISTLFVLLYLKLLRARWVIEWGS